MKSLMKMLALLAAAYSVMTHEKQSGGPAPTTLRPYPRSSDNAFRASLLFGLIFKARSNCCRACAGWFAF